MVEIAVFHYKCKYHLKKSESVMHLTYKCDTYASDNQGPGCEGFNTLPHNHHF